MSYHLSHFLHVCETTELSLFYFNLNILISGCEPELVVDPIPVFLSVGHPHLPYQEKYISELEKTLLEQGIQCRTLGRSEWSLSSPLIPVQKMMTEVYGAVILAFERYHSIKGVYKEGSSNERHVGDSYFPTVWNQLEGAMAFQLDLPLLLLKDSKLVGEGIFDPQIHAWQVMRIDPSNPGELYGDPFKKLIELWTELVKKKYYSQ